MYVYQCVSPQKWRLRLRTMIILGGKGEGHTAAETVPKRKSPVLGRPLGSHTCAEAAPCVRHGPASAASERFGATHEETRSHSSHATHAARRAPGPLGAPRVSSCADVSSAPAFGDLCMLPQLSDSH